MKKILSLVLVLATLLSCVSLAAADETVKITYFPGNSMAGSGELTGGNGAHFAKHGLVVEIIPYSAEKLQGMLASGDLADVMWLPEQELKIAMEADMLLNLEEYLPTMTALQENAEWFTPSLNFAREYNSNGTGNVYYLAPVGGPTIAVAADTDRNAIKMNWALYKNSGYPAFSSLEDSIEVFKKMQQDNPTNEAGLPTYAIHMFSDFDTEYFYNMYSIYSILGKDYTYLPYGIEYDASTHSGTSIFAEGSVYYRGLKYFYEMNKAGLVDPDSMSQTRSTAKAKIESGAALAGLLIPVGNPMAIIPYCLMILCLPIRPRLPMAFQATASVLIARILKPLSSFWTCWQMKISSWICAMDPGATIGTSTKMVPLI